MREGIHPNFEKTTITCHCGNVMETMSTKKDIKVEICSKCHPFFTGKQKLVDTGGRAFQSGLISRLVYFLNTTMEKGRYFVYRPFLSTWR